MDATTGAATSVASTSKVTLDRDRRRRALRAANAEIWRDGPKPPSGPFDSNIKKNTGFIKRVRQTLGLETRDQLIREVGTLNLDKYAEEVVQAIPEGLSKCTSAKDYLAAAESLSALFRRFGGDAFGKPVSALLAGHLAMPSRASLQSVAAEQRERDEAARVARQRVLLRASAELAVVDLVRGDKGKGRAVEDSVLAANQDWLFNVLKDLLATDKEHANVPILVSLLKGLGSVILGPSGEQADAAPSTQEVEATDTLAWEPEARAKFRKLCETYYGTLTRRMLREHERLQEQDRRNNEAYIKSGEVFEDRQQSYEKMTQSFERLRDHAQALAALLGVPVPALTSSSQADAGAGLAINLNRAGGGTEENDAMYASGKSLWEDEDTRRFYEDVVDLADMVPPALLGHAKGQAEQAPLEDNPAKNEDTNSTARETSPVASPQLDGAELEPATDGPEMSAGPAAQLNALLIRLPELSSRTLIDSAAVDFAFLANKLARRKLVRKLLAVPRSRSDIIPYYARLVAALNRYMPDVGQAVIGALDEELRYSQRKRIPELAEMRSKTMRFLGELVKFRVAPQITTFHCFKVLLDDFVRTNIEMLAVLLETCGRFLLRSPDTSDRMQSVLELMRRKRAAANLDQRQTLLLDNAYYQCNPPEREAMQSKQRTPMELYIQFLIYDELARDTVDVVLQRLRKLSWQDELVRSTLQNAFVRPWRIKFSHLHLLTIMLYELQTYHMDFVVQIVDATCEQIRSGMETNIFRDNQRRVATIKYFGELYNYRLINTGLIFETLWSLVTFGHPRGQPLPGQVSPIDAPDDYFRIRLICTLLDTCGQCFDRGAARKRLDDFLLFFNMYILSKAQPLPMDADFMLSDTVETLRPKFSFKTSFEEAATAVDQMLAAQREKALQAQPEGTATTNGNITDAAPKEESDSSSESSSEDEGSDAGSATRLKAPRNVSKDVDADDGASSDEGDSSSSSGGDSDDMDEEDEEEGLNRHEGQSSGDVEAEEEFARDLAKMMAESNAAAAATSANRNQRNLFDIGVPFVKRAQAQAAAGRAPATNGSLVETAGGAGQADDVPAQHMRFSLLSKRGNKQQAHEVHVPLDAALAVHSRANEQQQREERQQLKKLVLGMEGRDQNDRGELRGRSAPQPKYNEKADLSICLAEVPDLPSRRPQYRPRQDNQLP